MVFLVHCDSMVAACCHGSLEAHHNVPDPLWQHGASILNPVRNAVILQYFDAVGWVTGTASGL